MSNTNPPGGNREGYLTVSSEYGGFTYTFNFYQGFVRRLAFRPRGSAQEIEVYVQQGTYYVPQPPHGRRGPDAVSTVSISGGPDALDIELEVDDRPQNDRYRGPIEGFVLRTQRDGTPGDHDRSVRALRGGNQVRSLSVQKRPEHAPVVPVIPVFERAYDGGTSSDEETFAVDNNVRTCPPDC